MGCSTPSTSKPGMSDGRSRPVAPFAHARPASKPTRVSGGRWKGLSGWDGGWCRTLASSRRGSTGRATVARRSEDALENTAAAVASSNNRLYVGTNQGHLLVLEGKNGARVWGVNADDSVVATPLMADDRIVVGSFDGRVYAVDTRTGATAWEFDTHAAVTSAAAAFDGSVVVGSRSYDLFALDAAHGHPRWSRYFWFSWVESPATIDPDVAYIGSSDAGTLQAYDARSGRTIWRIDIAAAPGPNRSSPRPRYTKEPPA